MCRHPQHVCHAKSATSALARPCLSHIPMDVLYGELASGARRVGRSAVHGCLQTRYLISIDSLESAAADYDNWQQAVQSGMRTAGEEDYLSRYTNASDE